MDCSLYYLEVTNLVFWRSYQPQVPLIYEVIVLHLELVEEVGQQVVGVANFYLSFSADVFSSLVVSVVVAVPVAVVAANQEACQRGLSLELAFDPIYFASFGVVFVVVPAYRPMEY